MSNINFSVREREVSAGGVRISIGMPTSDREPVHNNELLNILNTLKRSQWADPDSHIGFDYVFDIEGNTPDVGGFRLGFRLGFPYVFEIQGDDPDVGGFRLR